MLRQRIMKMLQSDPFIQSIARPGTKIRAVEYFAYPAAFETIAVAGTAETTIQTAADSDFVLVMMTGMAFTPAMLQDTTTFALVQILEGQGNNPLYDQQWTNAPSMPFFATFGYRGEPFILPVPRVFRPNSKIRILLNHVRNANNNAHSFRMLFGGMRIYYVNPGN